MFKKRLGLMTKTKEEIVVSPVTGKVIALSEVPDPVFSTKMMGDGIAVFPEEGEIVSPIHGTVVHVFPTKHAIALKSKNGLELLIHIGLETVGLNGEGFTTYVEAGQEVTVGQPLVYVDLTFVAQRVPSIIIPIIVTNGEVFKDISISESSGVVKGKDVLLKLG